MAVIVVGKDNQDQQFVELSKESSLTVGRERENDISFFGNGRVSRHHCEIYYFPEKSSYAVRDCGSKNGTYLNGSRIPNDMLLTDGDHILVGNEHLFFQDEDSTSKVAKVAKAAESFSSVPGASQTQVIPRFSADHFRSHSEEGQEFQLNTGLKIDDHEIVRKLGDGHLASVYLANNLEQKQQNLFALKIFHRDLSDNQYAQDAFLASLQEAASYQHELITLYYSAGIFQGHCYYTMDYHQNGCLNRELDQRAPLPELESLEIAEGIARAMDFCYRQYGLIHRNLNPSNILMNLDMRPVVSDYEVSDWASKYLTEGYSCASPFYISPEQVMGDEVDWYSDLYSLGIILFQMLTGERPFEADDEEEMLYMQVGKPMPTPAQRNPNIKLDPDTMTLLRSMTAKRKDNRFPSWTAFVKAANQVQNLIKASSPQPEVPQEPERDPEKTKSTPFKKSKLKKKKVFVTKRK